MLNKSNGIADFSAASKAVTPAVVHIKTLLKPSTGKLILENLIARNPEATFLQWLQVLVF
jgi:hypothetical protein